MPEINYPGVYIEETAAGARTIEGVPTSITAFVGRAWRGPVDQPAALTSFADYERHFGGLWRDSTLSYAVRHFFENGGTHAFVVRVATRGGASAAKTATIKLKGRETFRAASPGSWGLNLSVTINRVGLPPKDKKLFNLAVTDDAASKKDSAKRRGSGLTERFVGVSVDRASPQFVGTVLETHSRLLRLASGLRANAPADQANAKATAGSGTDGKTIGTAEVTATSNRARRTGLYALDTVQHFNLLCLPPFDPRKDNDIEKDWMPAAAYCARQRALLIVDAPSSWTASNAAKNVAAFGAVGRENAALYFPRVLAPDPLDAGKPAAFAPSGMVAGLISRVDATRGVWKAPAGKEATLRGAAGLSINGKPGSVGDAESEQLNTAAINCLRAFAGSGVVVWGARTLAGVNVGSPHWKYVNVRRFFLFVEGSLYRGTQWVVFEPNGEPTWVCVRQSAENFLNMLFRQGAFPASTPKEAFYVRCDRSTMTQDDIDGGRLILEIGIAPVRPAEFVILRIFQSTGS